MRQTHTDDKFFLTTIDGGIHEGYLRRMRRSDAFPKEGAMLAVAYGHDGKIRLGNALGHMKTFTEAGSLEEVSTAAAGKYSLVAAYYVAEALDEPATIIQHIKGLLLHGGSLMIVVRLEKGLLNRLRGECTRLGLHEVQADFWRTEPLNTWDQRGDDGRLLSPLAQSCSLLRNWRAQTASLLYVMNQNNN